MATATTKLAALMLAPLLLAAQQPEQQGTMQSVRPSYVLGPNDQIMIRAFEVEELSDKPFRIESDGTVNLPLLGRIQAAGLTIRELEEDLIARLKTYVRVPQVTVTVVQFRADPVFFIGAFAKPGIYPLQGRRTLIEMLTAVGGLLPNASRRIRVTRRTEYGPVPLPNAVTSGDGSVSTVEIGLGSLRENVNPAEDIILQPYDVITAERAEAVYVQGEVNRQGPIELGERESISVLQVLAMVGGLSPSADASKARILRPVMNSTRRAEIQLNLKRILKAEANDYPLLANDVLYIPPSRASKVLRTTGVVAIGAVPTILFLLLR
jgi:polysaccharide export outer membrane protein